MTDLTKLTLTEARDGLAKKTFTSTELTDAFIAAIDKANPAQYTPAVRRQRTISSAGSRRL